MNKKLFRFFAAIAALAIILACAGGMPAPVAPTMAPTALIETAEPPAMTEAPAATDTPVPTPTLAPTPGPECPVLLDSDVPAPYIPLPEGELLDQADASIQVVTIYTDCEFVTASVSFGKGGYIRNDSIGQTGDGNWVVTQIFVLPESGGVHPLDREMGKVACRIAKFILTARDRGVLSTNNSGILWRPGQGHDEDLPTDCDYYNP